MEKNKINPWKVATIILAVLAIGIAYNNGHLARGDEVIYKVDGLEITQDLKEKYQASIPEGMYAKVCSLKTKECVNIMGDK